MKKISIILTIFLIVGGLFLRPARAAFDVGGASGDPFEEYDTALEDSTYNMQKHIGYNIEYLALFFNQRVVWGSELANRPGLIKFFANLVDQTYNNQPTSSSQYFAYLRQKFQLAKPAYAQGKGWQFLTPILDFWKAMRDITYLFSIVVLVILGLMVMFRVKVDPQTTISIQTGISKIVIALILITFSYAICGLIVDIAFLGNQLMGTVFGGVVHLADPADSNSTLFAWDPNFTILSFISEYAATLMGATGGVLNVKGVVNVLTNLISYIAQAFGGDLSPIVKLVIGFAFISAIIKIFFSLLSRYVMLILYTIFSPLLFLFGVVPGQSDHISRLFKGLLTAALSFPATLLLLHLAGFFAIATSQWSNKYLFEPLPPFDIPLTGQAGQGFPQIIGVFICLGILMVASKLPESLDDALGVRSTVAPSIGAEATGIAKRIPVIGGLLG